MDMNSLRTLRILENIEEGPSLSQRDLARALNISLGLANSFVKRLAGKGYFEMTTVPKSKAKYIITPKGIAEKTRLTYEYIQYSYDFYKSTRQRLRNLFAGLEGKQIKRIVFYGVSDLAEIAYISLQETRMTIVGIVDGSRQGEHFFGLTIADAASLPSLKYDRLIVTSDELTDDPIAELRSMHIPEDRILLIS